MLEAEKHIGEYAITNGGNVPLGSGISVQKKRRRWIFRPVSPDVVLHSTSISAVPKRAIRSKRAAPE
jgi:hypothetical protein